MRVEYSRLSIGVYAEGVIEHVEHSVHVEYCIMG